MQYDYNPTSVKFEFDDKLLYQYEKRFGTVYNYVLSAYSSKDILIYIHNATVYYLLLISNN